MLETLTKTPPIHERILIVDDTEDNRDLLALRLDQIGYPCDFAADGTAAIERMRAFPYSLVLLDLIMPKKTGFEVLDEIKRDLQLKDTPIIIISSLDDVNTMVRSIELGAVDHLAKPFSVDFLRARIQSTLAKKRERDKENQRRKQLEQTNRSLLKQIRDDLQMITQGHHSTIHALAKLAEFRDSDTGAHLVRIREYCRTLADYLIKHSPYRESMSKDFPNTIFEASPLHDIGKVAIPDEILQKPGKLSVEEFETMKDHARLGGETLREIDRLHPGNRFLKMGIEIAESHHEKWDGSGYPLGLSGETIPLSARILALADVYEALTSDRCYRAALPHDKARDIVLEGRGKHFDPYVTDAFLALESNFKKIHQKFASSD